LKLNIAINDICIKLVKLHEDLVAPILIKYAKQSVITGEPIIRPLWWSNYWIFNNSNNSNNSNIQLIIQSTNNSDIQTYTIDNQFLVGNEILVALIVNENKYEQDIYKPNSSWKHFNGTIYTGHGWFRNF
jgi:alpha-glucosidase (family GH31 glycosyl hydrolase)